MKFKMFSDKIIFEKSLNSPIKEPNLNRARMHLAVKMNVIVYYWMHLNSISVYFY